MSVRNDILNRLVTGLQGITKVNGYNTNVRIVSRKLKSWEDVSSDDLPALFVIDDGDEIVDNDSGGGQWIFSEYRPSIIGYVQNKEDVSEAFGLLDADLKKFLYSGPDLGDNCKQVLFEGYDAIFTVDDFILFILRPFILYDFDISNP